MGFYLHFFDINRCQHDTAPAGSGNERGRKENKTPMQSGGLVDNRFDVFRGKFYSDKYPI